MHTAVNHLDMNAVDALWILYRQQPQQVRDAFRSRIIGQEQAEDLPIVRSHEEMEEVSCQRMRNIIAGHERVLSHDEAMRLVDQAIKEAV